MTANDYLTEQRHELALAEARQRAKQARHRKSGGNASGAITPRRQDRARRLAGGAAGAAMPRPARRPPDEPVTRAANRGTQGDLF